MQVCTIQHGLLKVCGIGIKFGRARSFTNFLSFFLARNFLDETLFSYTIFNEVKDSGKVLYQA